MSIDWHLACEVLVLLTQYNFIFTILGTFSFARFIWGFLKFITNPERIAFLKIFVILVEISFPNTLFCRILRARGER